MRRNLVVSLLILSLLFSSASASPRPPVKIVSGVVSNVVSVLVKWLWSLKSTAKPGITSSRSMMKFESGYSVETVFDGSKMGIEPYSVQVSPSGQLLVLDSENSNIFKISTPLSRYSRPKLVAGSFEGYTGHVDGRHREARLNHPKGLTVDDRGNVYVADTANMAIRKISDTGVSTIAGGKWGRGGDHVDGPSEDAKFSSDFDVVYLGSSCSLLVIDRGNQAIREIQLNDEDCSYHYDTSFHLGIAMLVGATFFGYMLALLQRRVQAMFSSQDDIRAPPVTRVMPMSPYQKAPKSVRPPLIPPEDESERQEESFIGSIGRLFVNTGSSVADILGGVFFRRKQQPRYYPQSQTQQQHQYHQQQHQPNKYSNNAWPMQESFVIPDGDEPPPQIETRPPSAKRPYPMTTSKEIDKNHHVKQSRAYYAGWDGEYAHYQKQQQQHQHQHHQQMLLQQQQQQQQQHHHRQYSATPKTFYEKSCETNEIVFGAVQEQDGRREAVVIKSVDYADPMHNHHNIRPRVNYNYMGYSQSHAY